MDQFTLVLPFGLVPPEFLNDLSRALQAPALTMLLSRNSSYRLSTDDGGARVLPHEAWLARAFGAASQDAAPFAAAAMVGLGVQPAGQDGAGRWFIVEPVHVQLARTHMTLADPRGLRLDEAGARALYDTVRPYFDELGMPLLYGGAHTWFMRADGWHDLRTASPDAAINGNLSDWMPDGAAKRDFRKLQNEVQMLWHEHPVNAARQARGLPPVNTFWLWAGADAARAHSYPGTLATSACPQWLTALADPEQRSGKPASRLAAPPSPSARLDALLAQAGDATMVLGELIAPGLSDDWSQWLMQMQELEQRWFAPLLAAVQDGRIKRLHLVLGNRNSLAESTVTRGALRKFWRKPNLNKLST